MPERPRRELLAPTHGGDGFEREIWPHLYAHFPSYEVFWGQFVWDLTNRVYSGRKSRPNVHFRHEIELRNPDLLWMAQAHYTAFRRIGYAVLRTKHPKFGANDLPPELARMFLHDRFTDVFVSLLAADDMISALATRIHSIRATLELEPKIAPLTKEFVDGKVSSWLNGRDFRKARDRSHLSGSTINIPLVHRGTSLARLLPKDLCARYENFRNRAADYRNFLHNPQPVQIWIGEQHRVPKHPALDTYDLWSKVTTASGHELERDFEPAEEVLNRYVNEMLELVEPIWQIFISKLAEAAEKAPYQNWLKLIPEAEDSPAPSEARSYDSTFSISSSGNAILGLSAVRSSPSRKVGF